MRFVTALVLMGLLLGAGGARTGPSGPALAAAGPRPAAAQSTVEDVGAARPDAPDPGPVVRIKQHPAADLPSGVSDEPPVAAAGQPPVLFESAVAADERSAATGSVVPTVLVRADLLGGQPDRPVLGAVAGVAPAGDAYARVVGPRAPPLG
ncbi:hypothetical protein [Plantactinospora sp. BB1]|uniref:hypothetical protein n=1 Tax=Plantactinospora sp. BB1 TaxID=2071627 RepID=UPI000D15FC81|nr:hypothetical protein [Plantactinospora sp. BB1]AVT38691.1 hypothetical protein C6W10_22165 [Plantactinospora sp. BB1]